MSAKSWPGAVWSQIVAICRLLEASGKFLGSFENSRKRPCPCVKRAAARNHQGTSVFQSTIFPVGRVELETVLGHFGALVCFSEARNGVFGSPGPLQSLFWAGLSSSRGTPPQGRAGKHSGFRVSTLIIARSVRIIDMPIARRQRLSLT